MTATSVPESEFEDESYASNLKGFSTKTLQALCVKT